MVSETFLIGPDEASGTTLQSVKMTLFLDEHRFNLAICVMMKYD